LVIESPSYASVVNELERICNKLAIGQLYLNREYAVNERARDDCLKRRMNNMVCINEYNGDCLVQPNSIFNQAGLAYKVFTPFAKKVKIRLSGTELFCYSTPMIMPSKNLDLLQTASVSNKRKPKIKQNSLKDSYQIKLAELEIQLIDSQRLLNTKHPINPPNIEEGHLLAQLLDFVAESIANYQQDRDYPNLEGTSKLSFGLAVGAISVRRCYQLATDIAPLSADCWLNELIWRDFYRYVMWHFPHVSKTRGFRPVDHTINWSNDIQQLERWKKGQTGIPIIDAAMRQLVATGWMHNRLRMITACFLCKNLWINWRQGEAFFAEHLFDYDFASNNGGWQWCASVGTDSAPYFRVFNPASQQKRFDPQAKFIKQWLPELSDLSAKEIHNFESKPLSNYYPLQVDIKYSRKLAIENFKYAMK